MRKTILKFENHSASSLSYVGQGVSFTVPGLAIGTAGILVTVDTDHAAALEAAVSEMRPAMVITTVEIYNDGKQTSGIAPTTLVIPEKTPVNAVAATGVLTSDGTKPLDEVAATAILVSNETIAEDGSTVTLNETVYTFKTVLSTDPAVPYEVLIGATYDVQMANLALAINGGSGEGTNYSTGTVAHLDVTAGEVDGTDLTVTANVAGAIGNEIEKATTSANLDWDGVGAYLTGGRDVETVTIDGKTYTWKTALTPIEGEVLIGANATAALLNLKNAINHTGTPDTDYSCSVAHPTVTATASTATTLTVSAVTKGETGNAIALSEAENGEESHVSWGADVLAGGVNGTVSAANETCGDGTYLYHCIAANTVADANWRRVSLGTAY